MMYKFSHVLEKTGNKILAQQGNQSLTVNYFLQDAKPIFCP